MTYADNAYRDQNFVPTLIGVSSDDGVTPTRIAVDPTTGRVLVDLPSAGLAFLAATGAVNGSNTSFTFVSAPTVIVVDQGRTMQKTSSDGGVNWTGTTSVTLSVAPTFDIFGMG